MVGNGRRRCVGGGRSLTLGEFALGVNSRPTEMKESKILTRTSIPIRYTYISLTLFLDNVNFR